MRQFKTVYNTTVPAPCLPHTGFTGVWTPATHAEFSNGTGPYINTALSVRVGLIPHTVPHRAGFRCVVTLSHTLSHACAVTMKCGVVLNGCHVHRDLIDDPENRAALYFLLGGWPLLVIMAVVSPCYLCAARPRSLCYHRS